MLQSPCVCRRSSAVAENSVGLGQGHPPPDSVLAVVGMTDGVWQGGSVTRILL